MMRCRQSRLIMYGTSLVRRLCTAAAESVRKNVAAKSAGNNVLYKKLSALGITGRTVEQTLTEYKMEGKFITKQELGHCIRGLRSYRRYDDALEIMEWMKRKNINFSDRDNAMYLDLIAKCEGITAAESYFNMLPPPAQNQYTYGSLLNCYCRQLMTEEALALFEKMNQLNFVSNSLPYNNLMTMYMKLRQPEKVLSLVEQMKQEKIFMCNYTYQVWMQSHGSLNDIDGVERVFEEMKDTKDMCSWRIYSNLAAIYVKFELFEKAEFALKRLEEMKPLDREAYHYLISLYASTSNLEEVTRVWNVLKSAFSSTNKSNLVMLQALSKLHAIDRLKHCFEEWESSCSSYDVRLANFAICAYLKHDMYEEAASVFDNAIKRTKGPYLKAREAFMIYYLKSRQSDLAWNEMGAAISEAKGHNWKPSVETVAAFFRFFIEEKDVDGAEKFCRILKSVNCLNSNAYSLLMRTYMAAGKLAPEMRQRLEEDGVKISHELDDLLASSIVKCGLDAA